MVEHVYWAEDEKGRTAPVERGHRIGYTFVQKHKTYDSYWFDSGGFRARWVRLSATTYPHTDGRGVCSWVRLRPATPDEEAAWRLGAK